MKCPNNVYVCINNPDESIQKFILTSGCGESECYKCKIDRITAELATAKEEIQRLSSLAKYDFNNRAVRLPLIEKAELWDRALSGDFGWEVKHRLEAALKAAGKEKG